MLRLYEKVGEKKAVKTTERRRSTRLLAKKKSNYPSKSNPKKASGGMLRLNEEVGAKKAAKTTFNEHLGKRVAKVFGLAPDDDGDCTYRGTVKRWNSMKGKYSILSNTMMVMPKMSFLSNCLVSSYPHIFTD